MIWSTYDAHGNPEHQHRNGGNAKYTSTLYYINNATNPLSYSTPANQKTAFGITYIDPYTRVTAVYYDAI